MGGFLMSTSDVAKKSEFTAWLVAMGHGQGPISDRRAAKLLGLSRNTVRTYREGAELSFNTRLSMAAVAFGLPAWRRAA